MWPPGVSPGTMCDQKLSSPVRGDTPQFNASVQLTTPWYEIA